MTTPLDAIPFDQRPWLERREVTAWPMDPGVYCYACGWKAGPFDAAVPQDVTRPEVQQALAQHLVASGHGDSGVLEIQEGGHRYRLLRLAAVWPEAADREATASRIA